MTPARLDEIRRRCEAATPGPWLEGGPYPDCSVCIQTAPAISDPEAPGCGPAEWEPVALICPQRDALPCPQAEANRAFVAEARTDVPALLAEVDALRAALDFLANAAENMTANVTWGESTLEVVRDNFKVAVAQARAALGGRK